MAIICVSGLISSGKDTIADYLVQTHGFQRESFAATLKDAVAAIFGWPRDMLEGRTPESRIWRETIDSWWANRLNIPNFTPRWALQNMGTDVLRKSFHDDIWIASLEYKLKNSTENIVISDCRFPNEISALRKLDATIVRVKRGADPIWFSTAQQLDSPAAAMAKLYPHVHSSEYGWVNTQFDIIIENNGTLSNLYAHIDQLLNNCILLAKPTPVLDMQFL